jgi:hypothetical protein
MRAAILLLAAALGCAAADTDTTTTTTNATSPTNTTMRTLATGAYAAARPESPQAIAITSASDYARIWEQTLGGAAPRPEIDFTKESVVLLLAGSKPSGGYSVEPRGARLDSNVLVVDAAIKSPPPDAIVTMALTSPWAAIAVDAKFETVRWNP